jgi:hypothetical protein
MSLTVNTENAMEGLRSVVFGPGTRRRTRGSRPFCGSLAGSPGLVWVKLRQEKRKE